MKIIRKIANQRRHVKRIFVKNKDVAIIANNCIGAALSRDYALKYNSPTLNLQISAFEFPKFCKNISKYIQLPLEKVEVLTEYQKKLMVDMYGSDFVLDFPVGVVGDITIFFQHYKEFEVAQQEWDRRRKRVKLDNCIFLFNEKFTDKYQDVLKEFDEWEMDKKRKLVMFVNFDIPMNNSLQTLVYVPQGEHCIDYKNDFHKYYQNGFSYLEFINSISR